MSDLIGKTLGGYRIIQQIGLGGMATVYQAFQPSMDRYVALKVLSTHLTQDPTFAKRFQQEAKVIAKLEHLHILPVYDHGEEDSYLYLVMRFIQAGTLKDRLARDPLPLDEARRLVMQVGSALEYAHQLGVVHRDLKPSNILIDPQGDCYLTDFGIAKMVEGTLGLTGSAVLGTPHYMAPEQSLSLKVDHRADVYAMGVIIYEMVTGQLPFDAETPFAVVMKHISEPLPLPRRLRPDLPEAVERVILKALAKEPADRYQSMRDLVMAFDQAVQGVPTGARAAAQPPVAGPRPAVVEEGEVEPTAVAPQPAPLPGWRRWLAAQPLWLLAIAGLALVVLVLAGLILSRVPGRVEISGGQVQLLLPTGTATPVVEAAAAATPTPTPTARPRREPSATPTPRATPTREATRTPRSTATPQPTNTPSPLQRGEQLVGCDGELCIRGRDGALTRLGLNVGRASWSPDGSQILFNACWTPNPEGGCSSWLYLAHRDGSNVTTLLGDDPNYKDSAWSPDGEWIAYLRGCTLELTRPNGADRRTLFPNTLCLAEPAWSPDSQSVAWIYWDTEGSTNLTRIWVIGRDGSDPHTVFETTDPALYPGDYPGVMAWSPDGQAVAVRLGGKTFLIDANCHLKPNGCDESSRTELAAFPEHWHHTFYPQWAGEAVVQAPPSVEATPTPQPTATPTPDPLAEQARAFAEPILTAIAGRPPDYQDDFSDPGSGWDVGTRDEKETGWEGGETGYADGEYFVRASPAYNVTEWGRITCNSGGSWALPEFSDLVIEVDGRFVSGERGDWQVHLRDGREQTLATEASGGYAVSISSDGSVNISRYETRNESGETSSLFDARGSFVKRGFETNHLQIIARGAQIAVLVNGQLVAFATDPDPFERGTVGLVVCNVGDVPLEARWDNLRLWDISNLPLP